MLSSAFSISYVKSQTKVVILPLMTCTNLFYTNKNSDFAIQVMSEKDEKIDKSNKNPISVKKLVSTNIAPSVEHARFHKRGS